MRVRTSLAATLIVAAGAVAAGQSVDEFDGWMRTIDEKNQSVQQAIAQQDVATALADAKALQASFALVERFWAARDDGKEAVALSREAFDRASGVERALDAKDFALASSESVKISGTCTPCHRLHRPLP
jgi:hypothetical protein